MGLTGGVTVSFSCIWSAVVLCFCQFFILSLSPACFPKALLLPLRSLSWCSGLGSCQCQSVDLMPGVLVFVSWCSGVCFLVLWCLFPGVLVFVSWCSGVCFLVF